MRDRPQILLLGTADTKAAELGFLAQSIAEAGGEALLMDVGVLASGALRAFVSNAEVAAAAGTTLAELAALGDENLAFRRMAEGAARRAAQLYAQGRIDALLALGGTMGTDLALDVASALPLGVPKILVSTIAFSPLIPPERICPDLTMLLWAGGLYGLNDLCRATLAQAAGAAAGAARAARKFAPKRPLIGMTSLGKSCLSYMVELLPALQARGYEVAVFHTTGMGGRAFEALAAAGAFAAVFDFSLQELANHAAGSVVSAGEARLEGAARRGTPQIVAPGAIDMIDFPAWGPNRYGAERGFHAHNRLIASVAATAEERRAVARAIAAKLRLACGPSAYLLPLQGLEAWDREGEPMHDPQALAAFLDETRGSDVAPTRRIEIDAHINDAAFVAAALAVFDGWAAEGKIKAPALDSPGAPAHKPRP